MRIKFYFLLTILAIFLNNAVMANDISEQGKSIFQARCAGCHKIGSDFTGPDLVNVDKRRSLEWIINFVKSSQTIIRSGDKDALGLFEKFNKIPMPDHKDLQESDIKSIIAYIRNEGISVSKNKDLSKTPGILQPGRKPVSSLTYLIIAVYLTVVTLLVSILYFAVHVGTIPGNRTRIHVNIILNDANAA